MQFETTITLNDFKAYQKAALSVTKSNNEERSFFKEGKSILIWIGIGFVGSILFQSLNSSFRIANHAETIIVTSTIISFIIIYLFILYIKKIEKRLEPLPDGVILGTHKYTLTDMKIVDQIGNHISSSTYDTILNIIETESNLFLFIDNNVAYVINKKNIKTELKTDDIFNKIREKCNSVLKNPQFSNAS